MTDSHNVTHTLTVVYTEAKIWGKTFFSHSSRQCGETCNYLLHIGQYRHSLRALNGRKDKECVHIYNKVPLVHASVPQLRSNKDLCWRLKLFL